MSPKSSTSRKHTGSADCAASVFYTRSRRLLSVLCLLMPMVFFHGSGFANTASLTRAEAVQIAKQRSGQGKVLGVKKVTNNRGQSVFRVKIINNGRVKVYNVTATRQSGS